MESLMRSLWLPFSCTSPTGAAATNLETSVEVSFQLDLKMWENAALYSAGSVPLVNSFPTAFVHLHTGQGHLKEETGVILFTQEFAVLRGDPEAAAIDKTDQIPDSWQVQ